MRCALSCGLALILLAGSDTGARGQPEAIHPPAADRQTVDQHRTDFVRTLDAMLSRHFATDEAFLARSATHIHVAALAAACEMRAWQWTKDERYLRSATGRMRRIAAKIPDIRESDFFTPFPLSFAYRAATEAGAVDEGLRNAMADFVGQRFKPRDVASLHNQTLIRACGLELAAQVWPDLPQAPGWHDYATTIAGLLETIEDVPENAPSYNAIDLVCVWLLADLLDRKALTATPGVRAMFQRYRDQVSPAGFLAPYGDSGQAPQPFVVEWPMNSAWAHYVAAFERAGREYRDSTLVWAAQRVSAAGRRHMPLGSSYTDIEPLFYSSFAVDWIDPDLEPRQPMIGSRVLTRADDTGTAVSDKLILAAGRDPGEAFLMSDLYCRGSHGHVNQHGAVTYFEYRDTPLLTALGYNNREPSHANLVFMAPPREPFPLDPEGFDAGVWQQASLPTSRLPPHDPARPFHRRIDGLNFRITAGRRGVEFTAADVRLTGGAAAPVVLDSLRSNKGWGGRPVPGDDGLKWQVPGGVTFLEKKGFARDFDSREHPRITFRWKLSNTDERSRPVILRVTCGSHAVDYHAQAVQLDPTLVNAEVRSGNRIDRGTLRYTGWFTPDTTLERHVALCRSGVLVVRDVLLPGTAAEGMVAGPIWHLASKAAPEAGPHWFNSRGGNQELLVWFAPGPGRDFGSLSFDVWSKQGQQLVFARQHVNKGRPVSFVTVLVPHDRGTDGAALTKDIAVAGIPDGGLRVTIDSTGDTVDF